MCGIDVGYFKRADLPAAESCIVGHRQHHSISQRLLLTDLKNVLPLFLAWNPRKPVMPLNQPAPAYRRAQWVSRADSFFDQEVVKEANHCEVLLQSGVRESASCFHLLFRNRRNLELSDAPNVGSDRRTNDRVKRDIFGLQKTEIAVQVSPVGLDRVRG